MDEEQLLRLKKELATNTHTLAACMGRGFSAVIEAIGLQASNQDVLQSGFGKVYKPVDFKELIERYGLLGAESTYKKKGESKEDEMA